MHPTRLYWEANLTSAAQKNIVNLLPLIIFKVHLKKHQKLLEECKCKINEVQVDSNVEQCGLMQICQDTCSVTCQRILLPLSLFELDLYLISIIFECLLFGCTVSYCLPFLPQCLPYQQDTVLFLFYLKSKFTPHQIRQKTFAALLFVSRNKGSPGKEAPLRNGH